MIYLVSSRPKEYDTEFFEENEIEITNDVNAFIDWHENQNVIQLDTETNMIENGPLQHDQRKILVLQFGSLDEEVQYVIDMVDLSTNWVSAIKYCLSSDIVYIAHNVRFEYLVIKSNLDISIENLHDTYLMSRIANTGRDLPSGYHGLAGCLERHLGVTISKEEQKTFDGSPMTTRQILYAAADVTKLGALFDKLKNILVSWGLFYVYDNVERHVLKAYSDMELSPMRIDMAYWSKLSKSFIEEANNIKKELNEIIKEDDKLVTYLKSTKNFLGINLIQPVNEYKYSWASTLFKRDVFNLLVPDLPKDIKTKPTIKKFLKGDNSLPMKQREFLNLYMERSYDKLDSILTKNHRDMLQDKGYYIPKDTILINWASPVQRLIIFKHYYPNLEDTNAKSLVRIKKNKLINKFKEWTVANKNVTSYGEGFERKYVRPDNTIAPFGLNQILKTGRISFGILLQMPAHTNKFRNAFFPPKEDWSFVDTDYSSMEVVIAALASGETPFLDAIKEKKDLHSMSASLMFKDKWKSMAEPGCTQIKDGTRCSCQEHNKFRDFSKAVTFGLFYGMSAHGLADRLDIEKGEAQAIIFKFFKAFPKFKKMFEENEQFAINNLYIRGLAPINRIRFFAHPEHPGDLGTIGRAAKNFPIQEFNASILKVALIKIREEIIKNKLPYKLHLPIHDEILTSCPDSETKNLHELQEKVMVEVAEEMLKPGYVRVETKILKKWEK